MRKKFYLLIYIIIISATSFAQPQLFGLAKGDAGKIIKFDINANKLSTAYTLTSDKAQPTYNDLLLAQNGSLFGMTATGGSKGFGILFSYHPGSSTYTKLVDFDGANGHSPYGSLIEAGNGVLYGVTERGGANNHGSVFSYNYKTNKLTLLYSFTGSNGRSPYGSLLKTNDGKLYGMTASGGDFDMGTLFSFDPFRNEHKVLYHFNGTFGRSPYGSLVQAKDQKLYGVTQFGGSNGFGVIFSLAIDENPSFTKLADFNWANGAWPNNNLVEGDNGKLYGMTESGGAANFGVIFTFDPATLSLSSLWDFSDANGRSPYGALVKTSDKKMYGFTSRGGSLDKGVLFSFDPSTALTPYKKIADFDGSTGVNPSASLIEINNVILPLDLINFSATPINGKVLLEWIVEKESDIIKYEIQRSSNGIDFTTIGALNAINSLTQHRYSFTDPLPAKGKNYYRIKIHERYNASHYSTIKVTTISSSAFEAKLLPNPVSTNANIQLLLSDKSPVKIKLYNIQGHLIKQWNYNMLDKGDHFLPISVEDIIAGNYAIAIETNEFMQVLQMIKINKR